MATTPLKSLPAKLKSPPSRNSPANYESAAREIEQEKQMVAALKRLSIGNLMSLDPDIPVLDASYSFFVDKDFDDPVTSTDSLALSKSSSELFDRESLPTYSDDENRAQGSPPRNEPGLPPKNSSAEDLLWVPANMHPEVNPQQFKHHVKTTIDGLLERKLSRLKSASRSKRSSLSLSTTDDVLDDLDTSPTRLNVDSDTKSHYSNPSLRKLTSELQAMSRLAGMDSNDAVTLARSLSTTSLGYSDVERLAFDEMENSNSPNSASQAELLDFGVDETSPTRRHTQKNTYRASQNSHQNHYNSQQRGPSNSPYGQRGHNQHHVASRSQKEDFALRRSRRVDYRKGPTTSLLGSQLQSNKAEKLAELRHNLATSDMPAFDLKRDNLQMKRSSSRQSMQSMQSINPRSSQVLFSYRGPKELGQATTRHSPKHSNNSIPMSNFLTRDSPYLTALPKTPVERNVHHTKYGQLNLTSKSFTNSNSPYPQLNHSLRNSSREYLDMNAKNAKSGQYNDENVGHMKPKAQKGVSYRKPSPQQMVYSPNYGKRQPSPQNMSQQMPGTSGSFTALQSSSRRQLHAQGSADSESYRALKKRDKTEELNQNLDLLRNEINEFKESLAKNDPRKQRPEAASPPQSPDDQQDFSFDLTSHDVSYEDTLGIEEEVLTDLKKPSEEIEAVKFAQAPQPVLSDSPSETIPMDKTAVITKPDVVGSKEAGLAEEVVEVNLPDEPPSPSIDEIIPQLSPNKSNEIVPAEVPAKDDVPAKMTSPETQKDEAHKGLDGIETQQQNRKNSASAKADRAFDAENQNEKAKSAARLESREPGPSKGVLLEKKRSKSKKTWPWSKDKERERSVSQTNTASVVNEGSKSPTRSVSSPEVLVSKREAPVVESKENVITKLFKKRRSSSVSHEQRSSLDTMLSKGSPESMDGEWEQKSLRRPLSKKASRGERLSVHETDKSDTRQSEEKPGEEKVTSRIRNKIKNIKKNHDERASRVEERVTEKEVENTIIEEDEEPKPKSTLEVQEKLKKSIKRYSRPNQPIEFTDSAFGFPLPPPSHSTLVMIDYRFPVHVERAIYRLSHLKLANPKRSLREQVLLSNFMYAYLNLVDHTLHLEQQMSLEEYEMEEPEPDSNLLGDQDVDTDFEVEDDYEESDFDSIKLDLDVKDTQISV